MAEIHYGIEKSRVKKKERRKKIEHICSLIERAKRLNPHYPSWYHFVNYLVRLRNAQYEETWEDVQKIHMNGTFCHPLFRAAVLGKLGRAGKAKPHVNDLLATKPDFLKRPREIIKLPFVLDEYVEKIKDGLCKAGVEELE